MGIFFKKNGRFIFFFGSGQNRYRLADKTAASRGQNYMGLADKIDPLSI